MGRSPCCSKEGLNRGAWTASEDKILTAYINSYGEGKWRNLPKRAGLKRCGKSCRLRWLNYLRPGIKRGNITQDEEELIIRLHRLLGNRWSLIAGRLPGRTDNEIKNYWNTTLSKRDKAQSSPPPSTKTIRARDHKPALKDPSNSKAAASAQVIQTKATRCTKVLISTSFPSPNSVSSSTANSLLLSNPSKNQAHFTSDLQDYSQTKTPKTQLVEENHYLHEDYSPQVNCLGYGSDEFQLDIGADFSSDFNLEKNNMCMGSLPIDKLMVNEWALESENNGAMDLDSLAFLLDSEGWPQP